LATETILEKLKTLEQSVYYLRDFKEKHTLSEVLKDKTLEWAVRYGLFESSQIVIDVACALSAEFNLGNPKSYKECIELLETHNYIGKSVASELIKVAGLRNLLVHEYIKINIEKLFNLLGGLWVFTKFIEQIRRTLNA